MADTPGKVTMLLAEINRGDEAALAELIPLVYGELRRLAGRFLREERGSHTLQPTALVHEAYLRLVDQQRAEWQNRAQFMAIAARLMRRILVDHARARHAAKRGGALAALTLDDFDVAGPRALSEEMLAIDQALERLHLLDPQQARIVELRYFGGLSVEETAAALSISERTVKRDWAMARAWLKSEFTAPPGPPHLP